MQRLVYLISYPFLWCIAAMPFGLFYLFSDFLFTVVFYLTRYRRKVVRTNLHLVFRDLSIAEIKQIEKEFYRHMCDVFLETIKTMRIGEETLKKRYRILNPEMLNEIEQERSVLILAPHYGNWEWSVIVNTIVKSKGYAVYQKIGNPYFDRLIRRIRAKFRATLIHQRETVRTVIRNEQDGIRAVYGIASDQSPQFHRTKYWRKFMGVTVPIFDGPENLARKLNLAVLYGKITKLKRGHYTMEFVPIALEGKATSEHEISDKFMALTEATIRENPAYYLWTHRRWKHRDKVPQEFL